MPWNTNITVDENNPVYDSRDNCNAIIETATDTLIRACQTSTIPDTVKHIGTYSFTGCDATNLSIPDSVISLGNGAFIGYNRSDFTVGANMKTLEGWEFCESSALKTVIFEEGPEYVSEGMFNMCVCLKTVYLPSTLKSIRLAAFGLCIGLTDIYYPGTMEQWKAISVADENEEITHADVHCSDGIIKKTCRTHTWKSGAVKKASFSAAGNTAYTCSVCGAKTNVAIPKIKSATLSTVNYTYDGKVKTPAVTVKDAAGKVIAKTNYTVTYQKGKAAVGRYAVKVTFKGNYSGSKMLYFNINPKGTAISKVKGAKKSFTVNWKKQATQTTGYQLQYSTNKNFKSGVKTVNIGKTKTVKTTVKKLAKKKTYYVRIRTYKKVGGKYYYSAWSGKKSVKTK